MTRIDSQSELLRPDHRLYRWVLTHRYPRRFIPPLILVALVALLAAPLINDMYRLARDDLSIVGPDTARNRQDGNLVVNIKDINPNDGVATIDVSYITDDIGRGKIELWLTSAV